ncbi:MAG: CRISPR-associated helicase Cas3' [Sedimentibacter sp.]|uniref:CRISPR-associated helicase Cas3' n=1 Tax=Sedimentibacter sp. TaxID=1960295 RepID=UPI002981EC4C|nr:CRISPR-associated helicase Cas3' [Sedimentibacter sp.]MDW5298890.1 CRISPR-associated helicase Cas3' [Sedimentibacter sp.]
MREILSHPNRRLKEHLNEVLQWGDLYKKNANCKLLNDIDSDLLTSFFIFHDIGKSTSFFQRYIRGKDVSSDLKSHAALSAMLFLYYHILKGDISDNEDLIEMMAYAILKHHGNLEELSRINDYVTRSSLENIDGQTIIIQYKSIDMVLIKKELIELGLQAVIIDKVFNCDEILFVQSLIDFFAKRRKNKSRDRIKVKKSGIDSETNLQNYFTMQVLFSLLIDSDKSQVSLGNRELVNRVVIEANVEKYIKDKGVKNSALNDLRSMAFEEVDSKINMNSNIYTLTLPTGMGKTLNSFNYAFKLREKLLEETNKTYRIIYVMPFMSIIDQNASVLEEILSKSHKNISSNMLCKHHHLTEIEWITNENTLIEGSNAQILIEGWNSEIIIATFQQFFSTLVGYKNSMQRKFNKLSNSIVIIDEIQTIPVKYYKFIGKLLTEYADLMDSKVIAMTATQPHIFSYDASEQLCEYKKYYTQLNRTKIINELNNSKTIDEFVDDLECVDSKSYLFILNTIESSKNLYLLLKEKINDRSITYLSTLLPPKVRMDRIRDIKEKKYDIVVSTQLVEAGVDIDFNVVYRDLAPLPSIFQSAGRANREGKGMSKGEVHIVKLKDNKSVYADKVYRSAKTDLDITEKLLKDYNTLDEPEFMLIIEKYFDKIADESIKSQHISDALLKGAQAQWFYGENYNLSDEKIPLNSFELIENNGEKFQTFIELDDDAELIWNEYMTISNQSEDKWEHKIKLKSISRKMSEYIVDVNVSTKSKYNRPPLDSNNVYYYVGRSELDKYYNEETGYGVESDVYYF